MKPEDDGLDSLMERALASYTAQEARPGLERRILASVAAANTSRPRGWSWKSVWALAAGAALVAAMVIPVVFRSSRPEIALVQHPAAGVEQSAQSAPSFASPAHSTLKLGARRSHATGRVPIRAQFGQPRPTREELLMARFAAKEPESMEALTASKPDLDAPVAMAAIPDNPIAIEPVEMKPIAIAPIETSSLN